MEIGLSPENFLLDEDLAPSPKRGRSTPIFGPCLLRSNGCMDQDGTWHGARPQPKRLCVRWGQSPFPQKGRSPPIFGPFLLWPNGWMHQDATWYGGRPQPRGLCVRRRPSPSPQKGGGAPNSIHVYCGQTAAWIKMPLGTEVGLGLRDIVLDGDPATPRKKGIPTLT